MCICVADITNSSSFMSVINVFAFLKHSADVSAVKPSASTEIQSVLAFLLSISIAVAHIGSHISSVIL